MNQQTVMYQSENKLSGKTKFCAYLSTDINTPSPCTRTHKQTQTDRQTDGQAKARVRARTQFREGYNMYSVSTDTFAICVDNSFGRFSSKLVYMYIVSFVMADWTAYVQEFQQISTIAQNFTVSGLFYSVLPVVWLLLLLLLVVVKLFMVTV